MATKQERRGVFSWMLYDWANQPFHALVITFIFAPYFASQVASDPVTGQSMWGVATAIAGLCVAAIAPFLGAIADRTGAKKPWVAAFSVPFVHRLRTTSEIAGKDFTAKFVAATN